MKEKKKLNKNNSFNGMESKKSPKSRRKSVSTVLSTPLKKSKKGKSPSQWAVSENAIENITPKRKQLVIEDSTDEDYLVINNCPLNTPNIKNKIKSKISDTSIEKKKSSCKIVNPLTDLKNISVNKEKKKGLRGSKLNDPIEIKEDEKSEKLGIKAANITKAIEAVMKLHSENPKLQNQLFEDRIPLFLQVTCHIVPRGPSRIIRPPIPNSLLTPDDEVCLIVPEVKSFKNIEHDKHVEHYENLLRSKGVENIKKIMTFHEFRTEHETFEQKSRLVDLYDMFLVDGRISGKVVKKCGKIFYKKRKVPTSVKLQGSKLKEHIEKALSKAFFLLHLNGNSYNVQFGHNKMPVPDMVENVFAILECLNKEFPGGVGNFKGVHINTASTTSIPIYSSFKSLKQVKMPKVKPKKPKAYKTYKDELTTLPNAEVVVKPTGKIFLKRTEVEQNGNEHVGDEKNAIVENAETVKVKKPKKRKHNQTVSTEGAKKKKITKGIVEDDGNIKNFQKGKKKKIKADESYTAINNLENKKQKTNVTKGEQREVVKTKSMSKPLGKRSNKQRKITHFVSS